jgi:hypothetical protein
MHAAAFDPPCVPVNREIGWCSVVVGPQQNDAAGSPLSGAC